MRCIYTYAGTGRRQEMNLAAALQPETACLSDDQTGASKAAIGSLSALLVQKGVITLDEAIRACGILGEIELLVDKKDSRHD